MRLATILIILCSALPALNAQSKWPAYGGDLGNTRYSALDQINPRNVTRLAQTWIFDTRPRGSAGAQRSAQVTPLVVNDVLYAVTAYQSLVALQPETGQLLWTFTHRRGGRPPRGLAYWPGDRTNPPEIIFGTGDGFLLAVSAKTGKAVSGSGRMARSI